MLLWRLFLTFLRIGGFTIGGGYVMLPFIQRDVVEKEKWVKEEEFLDLIAVAQAAPGVMAINSALIIGFKLAGLPGAAAATLGVSLPSFVIILVIASYFIQFSHLPLLMSFMEGARPVVVALLLYAALTMGFKSVKDLRGLTISIVALILSLLLRPSPIMLIIMGGLAGYLVFYRMRKEGEEGP
ncbi:MAG TPA: chromate transporter [Clostridia bacterium]|nr:chromate transporter [Clostridia bacterium]